MRSVFLLVCLCLATSTWAQKYSQSWKDVSYAPDTLVSHKLDIYLPEKQQASYPAVVVIYGSAWMSNHSKGADMHVLGKALLEAGYAVIMPNHRSSFEAKFPAQIQEMKAVLRFVRAHAAEYHIDTTFVAVTGSSSGGNMAAMLGTTSGLKIGSLAGETVDLEGTLGGNLAHSSSVDAVVDWFGPTNMLLMDSCATTDFKHNDPQSPASLYIGGPIQENKTKTLLASPTTYVDAGDPPFLIFHGDADRVVPFCQSEILFKAQQQVNARTEFHPVPKGQHGPGVHAEPYVGMMVKFFDTTRKSKK